MNIIHSIPALDMSSGGPVRAIIDLSTKLAEQGHTVKIITLNDKDAPETWKSNPKSNPQTITLGPMQSKGFFLSASQKNQVAQAFKDADVIHVHGIWEQLTRVISSLARKNNIPYIISLRGMLDDWSMDQRRTKKQLYLKLGGSKMLNSAAIIHCTAEGELLQSKKWFPKTEGCVVPNLLNLEPYETMPSIDIAKSAFPMFDSGDPVLLYLSRLHYKKGVEHLIEAIKILKDTGSKHRLLIAGDGDKAYESKLKNLTKTLDLNDEVAFVGLVVGDQKLSLYRASDLFVLPTSQENFGFVLYESLAAGTPLVTTKGVDTWPELQEQAGAIICDQDAQSIASTIKELTKDPAELDRIGQIGRQWIFDKMHPDQVIKQFEEMYSRVLA